jgi:4-hydroxy 2-oxovalerate aldolase
MVLCGVPNRMIGGNPCLIDVTLRDGSYQNNFAFDEGFIADYVDVMTHSGVDYIEIGYLKGTKCAAQPVCPNGSFDVDEKLVCTLKQLGGRSRLCVMFHPSHVIRDDLLRLSEAGVDLLRCCMPKGEYENSLRAIEFCASRGIAVTANIIRMSQLTMDEIVQIAKASDASGASVVYFADSNGSVHPDLVWNLGQTLATQLRSALGFHAHDNLGLAMLNAATAVTAGFRFIDASIMGMGKGGGNLRLETVAKLFNQTAGREIFQMGLILNGCRIIDRHLREMKPANRYEEFAYGMHDVNFDQRHLLAEAAGFGLDGRA